MRIGEINRRSSKRSPRKQIADVTLTGLSTPERLPVLRVSANYLDLLGARMILGRKFRLEEEPFAAPRVAIITYSFWKSHFGGDPSVLDPQTRA